AVSGRVRKATIKMRLRGDYRSRGDSLPAFDTEATTIEPKVVSALVQIAPEASNRQIGQSFITQGNLEHAEFACLLRWAERDAARLLCDEVAYRSPRFQVALRGAR
ncbi:hypothetical protein, partial [Xanthomonas translucens]